MLLRLFLVSWAIIGTHANEAYDLLHQPPDPLDPLTAKEIEATVQIIYRTSPTIKNDPGWKFNWITLKEPEKALLLPYFLANRDAPINSPQIPRRSFVILIQKPLNLVNEVVVNLFTGVVESWIRYPAGSDLNPVFTTEDNVDGEAIARADPNVQARCNQMGFYNMSMVLGEVWSVAYDKDRPELANAKRPVTVYMYGLMFPGDNHFAHPMDFMVWIDLATRKVIHIDDLPTHTGYSYSRDGNVCPKAVANFDPLYMPHNFYRPDVHQIKFVQPGGANYKIKGNEIQWQKFKFRVGFNGREGPIIHQVSYNDGGNVRPLFYRISVGELFVPYGDARPPYPQKYSFDESEFTLGYGAADLRSAGLCKGGSVAYIDISLNNEAGGITSLPAAVCVHEEDAGVLWAHLRRQGYVVSSRSTRLTVTSFCNVGNYDYKISWRFYQDGQVEFHCELHGILATAMEAVNVTDGGLFGNMVAPQILGQYHQHHLAIRIDTEIDGNLNTVTMSDIVPLAEDTGSLANKYGQGFTVKDTVLRTPSDARTRISPLTGRSWNIKNTNKLNPYNNRPVGWKLHPFNAPPIFVRRDSPFFPRTAWADYNVWVTKYREDQLYPGGLYINASGLPEWVKEHPTEDVTNTDVVLWYIYGFTHIPRTEDYPLMPVEASGFVIKPTNFFLQNPGLDVPTEPVMGDIPGGNTRRY